MCMGKTHAKQALPVAAATILFGAPLLGAHLGTGLAVAVVGLILGAAVLPDIDHPDATIAHVCGPVSHLITEAVNSFSATLYHLTRTRRDRDRDGGHRGVTHTALFAAAAGGCTAAAVHTFGPWAAGGILFALSAVAVRAFIGRMDTATWVGLLCGLAGNAIGVTLLMWWNTSPDDVALWFGLAVTLGCLTHVAGDCMTEQGCPVFFPVPIGGQVWRMVGGPRVLRFRTGPDSRAEAVLGFVSTMVAAALAAWFTVHAFGLV